MTDLDSDAVKPNAESVLERLLDRELTVAQLRSILEDRERSLEELSATLAERDSELAAMRSSLLWKVVARMRRVTRQKAKRHKLHKLHPPGVSLPLVNLDWAEATQFESADMELEDIDDAIRWRGELMIGELPCCALYQHPSSQISYRLLLPAGSKFTTLVALRPGAWLHNRGGVEFRVTAYSELGHHLATATKIVNPGQQLSDRRWVELDLDLGITQPTVVKLALETRLPPEAGMEYAWAVWGDPAVVSA